jgi:hypothetical protein
MRGVVRVLTGGDERVDVLGPLSRDWSVRCAGEGVGC